MRYLAAVTIVMTLFCLMLIPGILPAQDGPYFFNQFPAKGSVTMIDLGSDYCIPCKMMAPILAAIQKKYKEKADIVFIDIDHNKDQAIRFGVRVVPTQIFFDANQKEMYRHEGFMSEKEIESQLKSMGIRLENE